MHTFSRHAAVHHHPTRVRKARVPPSAITARMLARVGVRMLAPAAAQLLATAQLLTTVRLLAMVRLLATAPLLAMALALLAGGAARADDGIRDGMPAAYPAMKARMTFPMAWTPAVRDLPAWRQAGRAKMWELTLQSPDNTPFAPQVLDEVDRGSYVARKVVFNLSADSRVTGLLLVPKGAGPFPAALMLHDHGGRFDIGKEKAIAPWGDAAREAAAQAWALRYFSGRMPGDALAKRGYVVLAVDALGWGERGPMTADSQQALAANAFNLGSSLAGIMAREDARAADFLAAQPQVDRRHVAAVGFSMGAFRAWQVAALSDAITAVVAVNWMATSEGLMVPGNNQLRGSSAWHMLHPGALRQLDYPDVASLAAPKPALFFAGATDKLFPVAAVQSAFTKMAAVWRAWQAPDKFEAHLLPGPHEFTAPTQDRAYDWLDRQFGHAHTD